MYLHFKVSKKPEQVFEYLTDMNKFVKSHPIIFKIDDLGNNNYLVYERLKLGLIPVKFKYKVRVTGNFEKKEVNMSAAILRMVKIRMQFILKTTGSQTEIYETVVFNTLLPVKWVLKRVFRKQHLQLFKNIQAAC